MRRFGMVSRSGRYPDGHRADQYRKVGLAPVNFRLALGHKWVDLRFEDTATCGRWAARAHVYQRSIPRLNPELLRQLRVLHLSLLQDGDAGRGRKSCLREKLKAPPRQGAVFLLGRNRICQRQSHDFRVCLAYVRRGCCAIPFIVVLISA